MNTETVASIMASERTITAKQVEALLDATRPADETSYEFKRGWFAAREVTRLRFAAELDVGGNL